MFLFLVTQSHITADVLGKRVFGHHLDKMGTEDPVAESFETVPRSGWYLMIFDVGYQYMIFEYLMIFGQKAKTWFLCTDLGESILHTSRFVYFRLVSDSFVMWWCFVPVVRSTDTFVWDRLHQTRDEPHGTAQPEAVNVEFSGELSSDAEMDSLSTPCKIEGHRLYQESWPNMVRPGMRSPKGGNSGILFLEAKPWKAVEPNTHRIHVWYIW